MLYIWSYEKRLKIPKEVIRRGRTAKRGVGEKEGKEVGNRLVGSGRGEICKMGEN